MIGRVVHELRRVALVVLLATFSVGPVSPAHGAKATAATRALEPRQLAERFLDPRGFPDRTRYYTGEMLEHYSDERTLGQYFAGIRPVFRSLPQGDSAAVEAVTLRDSTGAGIDYYLHFAREVGGWKLAAVRTLWVPAFMGVLADSFAVVPDPPDSVVAFLDNYHLLMASDDSLVAYARSYRTALDSIVTTFVGSGQTFVSVDRPEGEEGRSAPVLRLRASIRRLHVGYVNTDPGYPGCVFVGVGGILDNEVGFLRVLPGSSPPRMEPGSWILVLPVGGGWYLFKTT